MQRSGPITMRKTVRNASFSGARMGICTGLALLAGRMIVAGDPLQPLRFAAALFLGDRIDETDTEIGSVVAIGLAVHLPLSVFYGLLYFWIHRLWSGHEMPPPGRRALSGALFGLVVWLLDFHLFAPLLRPWLVHGPALIEAFLHVVLFGIPLALLIGVSERRAGLAQRWRKELGDLRRRLRPPRSPGCP